jgi:predicted DNA-binding transcriptional regulator YafY
MWFDEQIRAKLYPNAKTLSESFEISVRQAGRDIEYMQNSLRAPLQYNAKQRGYEYADHAYILPSVFLTETDVRILNFLIYKYESAAASMGYMEGLDRVVQTLKLFVPYQPEDSVLPVFYVDSATATIKHELELAIKHRRKVQMTYLDLEEEYHVLTHPYQMYSLREHIYIIAYCEQSEEVEHYRLDHINKVTATSESYDKY